MELHFSGPFCALVRGIKDSPEESSVRWTMQEKNFPNGWGTKHLHHLKGPGRVYLDSYSLFVSGMYVGRAVAISQPVEPAHASWLAFNESHFLTCSMLIDKPLISAIETNVDTHLQIKKNHWLLIDISLRGGSVATSGIRLLGGTLIDLPQKCASDSDHVAGALHYLSFTKGPKRKSHKCDRK